MVLALVVIVASALAAAGLLKILVPRRPATLVSRIAARGPVLKGVVAVLPYVEIAIAACLVVPLTRRPAALASAVLLTIFGIVILTAWRRGELATCGCLGVDEPAWTVWHSVTANVALTTAAVLVLFGPEQRFDAGTLGLGVLATATTTVSLLLAREVRRRQLLESPGAAAADSFDVFDANLQNTNGGSSSVRQWLSTGRPHLVVFVDPLCGPCRSLLPGLAMRQRAGGTIAVAVVSRGPMEDNVAMAREFGLATIAVQSHDALSRGLGVYATPSALLLSASGSVLAGAVLGRTAILTLLDSHDTPRLDMRTPTLSFR